MNLQRVRDMVMRFGWNSTAYQILNPGMRHWWSHNGRGVVGYVRCAGVTLAAGAPLCDERDIRAINDELEHHAERREERVCYFCAAGRMEAAYRESRNHSIVAIGAQPVWDPHHWAAIIQSRASLRAQLNRARNKSVVVHAESPLAARQRPDIQQLLSDWLESRAMPTMHFMVEPATFSGIVDDRLLWVAHQHGHTVGFLLASPVALRNGYLIEQIVRSPRAPNGTAELLIDAAMRDLAARGCTYATLGLVALAKQANSEIHQNPLWLRILMSWARAHGRRFYNFDGLEAFRTKLAPDRWETVYAISNEPRFSPRTLYAVAAAFSNNHLFSMSARMLVRAAWQEVRWAVSRLMPA